MVEWARVQSQARGRQIGFRPVHDKKVAVAGVARSNSFDRGRSDGSGGPERHAQAALGRATHGSRICFATILSCTCFRCAAGIWSRPSYPRGNPREAPFVPGRVALLSPYRFEPPCRPAAPRSFGPGRIPAKDAACNGTTAGGCQHRTNLAGEAEWAMRMWSIAGSLGAMENFGILFLLWIWARLRWTEVRTSASGFSAARSQVGAPGKITPAGNRKCCGSLAFQSLPSQGGAS
jgi:hypothetical protein